MTFIEIIILAIIQGLTEFLPVSSSGHLSIMQTIFEKWKGFATENATLDVMLHFGTLLATALFFRKEIFGLARSIFSGAQEEHSLFRGLEKRALILMIVALIPTGIIGLALNPVFEDMLHNTLLVGITLGVTGIVLFSSRFFNPSKSLQNFTISDALIIGIAQGIAVMPGLSRSGVTIAAALMLGWEREEAFKFSFLISIPAILGATLLEIRHVDFQDGYVLGSYLLGMFVAAALGYCTLILLRNVVVGRRFYLFSFYCAAVAVVAISLAFM